MNFSIKFFGIFSLSVRGLKTIALFVLIFLMLTSQLSLAQKSGKSSGKSEEMYISLNLTDVDIGEFIRLVSKVTKKNFIIDDRVKGKVTIISPEKKISAKELYKVFESVLEVHGYATVEAGEVTKIVSSGDARSKNIETMVEETWRSSEDKLVTQLMPLKYAETREISRLFKPLVSKNSNILAYAPTNTLIITDIYSNIKRLLKILKKIDVPGVGQEISVIPLEHSDATKLVRLLTTVFQQKRTKKKRTTDTIKFVADERTNTIVSLASEDDTLRIKDLIARLDKELPRGTENIRVYYLEYATAEDLAKVLQSLSTKQKRTSTKKGKKQAPIVSEATNITADKATNSLIIMAEKDDYIVLEEVIKKLDIPRAMVYIECLIMEVNVDKEFNLGTEWMAMGEASHDGTDGGFGGGFSGGGDSPYSNIKGLAVGAGGIGVLPSGFSLGIFSEAIEIGGVKFPNLSTMIQAYKKDKNTHILSTPQLLTTDNEEASITVGKNVPYQTKTGTTSTSESYNTYEYKDVAITLKVTPQISRDRMIRLKIAQEVSKLDTTAQSGDERPTTLKRTIDTTVIVQDKNTIALGGLIDDSFSLTEYKVPCLGDIPGLGWLFKSISKGREKTNLFVFLTPHVIENPAEAEEIFLKKKEHIDTVEEGGIKMYNQQNLEEALPEPVE
ncbi:type II secretion system secretin GspD [Desulfonema magnum]|uniref:General secretion pathway protein D, GspD-like n=1 Tax=Desulfonema magnum TaxID=45655 RepID=A0A975BXM9_9BACT|nr:type II secretion system secretin GspD [Desulfonema magnum]QTA93232.1 Putative general secretion pathway protein D, GspD-like [Desulfonema magnum]